MALDDAALIAAGAGQCLKTEGCLRPAGHTARCRTKPRDQPPTGMGSVTQLKGRSSSLEKRLDGFIGGIGALVYPFDAICGGAVLQQSGDLAAALDALARENPKVKQTLERMLTGGAWSGVLLAAAPIAMAVAGHHILPLFGKSMSAPLVTTPKAQEANPHKPVPPDQQARQETGWNDAFAQGAAPEDVFGASGI